MDKCTHGWITPPECPSCMAIELESLRQENSRLREVMIEGMALCKDKDVELHRLRERMNQLTDDYEGTIKKLREALQLLYDNQNGPPLLKCAKQWNEAMRLTADLLNPPKNR